MRYKCLIFDHDDTAVNSSVNVHYPSFVEFMKKHRPSLDIPIEDFMRYNFNPGVLPFFREICGLSDSELKEEEAFWVDYTAKHVSEAFPGIREIMEKHRQNGGIICVVSHSFASNIIRDYRHNGLPEPDMIFGWEQPLAERKPSPYPVLKIMEKYSLAPEEVLVIDDLKPGLDMARSAGVDFAAALWCFEIPENEIYMRKNADYCFKSVSELGEMLGD